MDSSSDLQRPRKEEEKPKVVVIMDPNGSSKSLLVIDLAADSMQVHEGLDVQEQRGVPHHLLGTVNPNVEFTAKKFCNSAIPIINDILS
ncbi:hypothetical protein SLE2022_004660 [Rubroshorea leprosula]